MARVLLRPGWILTHLVVIAIAVAFTFLGFWQLDRHDERQDEIARAEAVIAGPAVPLDRALPADLSADDARSAEDVRHRPARATGTYLSDEQVQLSPRSNADRPGYEVLTPLLLDDGRTLIVNRGWMPLDSPMPAAPSGTVTVEGRLQPSATARQVLPPDGARAELVSNVDLAVLSGQVTDLVETAYLERVDEEALASGSLPRPAGPVDLSGGNHLSYAVQWFAFTLVGLVGYPLLLRRRIADRQVGDDGHSPGPDTGPRDEGGPQHPSGRDEASGVSK